MWMYADTRDRHSTPMPRRMTDGVPFRCHGRAALWGHRSVVELLLSRRANVHTIDQESETALHHAARQVSQCLFLSLSLGVSGGR